LVGGQWSVVRNHFCFLLSNVSFCSMNWFCAQIGAREHYAVPRAWRRAGRSMTLYTDFWAGPVLRGFSHQSRKLKWGSRTGKLIRGLQSLASRWHPELEAKRKLDSSEQNTEIISWNVRALWWEVVKRRLRTTDHGPRTTDNETEFRAQKSVVNGQWSVVSGPYAGFIEVGKRFAMRVRAELERQNLSRTNAIFYAYDTGALEALEWCREHGVKSVLNQMDPNRVEVELVQREEKQWRGWALQPVQVPEAYFVRREREWALADRVVVNSEFSRQALRQQGVPAEKLVVIPLCFEASDQTTGPRTTDHRSFSQRSVVSSQRSVVGAQKTVVSGEASRPLRVLFLGQVILRKGIQYLMAAAKRMERENIQFDVVGPLGISPEARATAPGNLTFHGRANRDQAAAWYQQADVFVLPTLSDGFAITQLEAMAYGLPVVTTPCCGEVVTDGLDGFVVPERDPAALAAAFQRYLREPDLLRSQSVAALTKSKQFSMDQLAANLMKLEAELTKAES
jgi:glycosyltransferase involved in cell wall biosynthesis